MHQPPFVPQRSTVAKHKPSLLSWALALALGGETALIGHTCVAQTLPQGAQALAGMASLSQTGKNLTVTTTNAAGSAHSAINWQSFSIGSGYSTYFAQPDAASTSINRVVTNSPSQIYGSLSSNGKVVLVNPAGIAVGPGAYIDTAGFTASTLALSEQDAKAGVLRFAGDGTEGALNVQGRIISRGADAVLIGPSILVDKDAVVEAPDGSVVLAAGRNALVTGRGMQGVLLEVKAPTDSAINLGQLKGDAVGIFAGTLKHSGDISATALSAEGGVVRLISSDSTEVSGNVRASKLEGAYGGDIAISSANRTTLLSGAVVDASGTSGGGTVAIGGGWQGSRADVVNAQNTVLEQGVTVDASASAQGNGGTISVWSDGLTQTAAQLLARGAGAGGDGGKVETSGHNLQRTGLPDVSPGSGGQAGTWLIDPTDVIIQLGTGSGGSGFNGSAASITSPTGATIYESEIETLGANTNIQILASTSIVAVAGSGSDNKLTLVNKSLSLGTTNQSTGPACTLAACGIDLTAFTNGIDTQGGHLNAVTGLDTNTSTVATSGVYAAPVKLPGINTSGTSTATQNGIVFVASSGSVNVSGDISSRPLQIGTGRAGPVSIQAATSADVQSISANGGSFSQTQLANFTGGPVQALNGNDIAINANQITVHGHLQNQSGTNADTSANMGPGGNINLTAQGLGLGSAAAIFFDNTSLGGGSNNVTTSSGGPNGLLSTQGPGFSAGSVSMVANNGRIGFNQLAINALGGDAVLGGTVAFTQTNDGGGGNGGNVSLRADNAGSGTNGIGGASLVVNTTGGKAGSYLNGSGDTYYGNGGNAGAVTLSSSSKLLVTQSVFIDASGSNGSTAGAGNSISINGSEGIDVQRFSAQAKGGNGLLPTAGGTNSTLNYANAGNGGNGGSVSMDSGTGNLSASVNTSTFAAQGFSFDVSGGTGSGDGSSVGLAGNGGTFSLQGTGSSNLSIAPVQSNFYGLDIKADGGTYTNSLSAFPQYTNRHGGNGGTVSLTMGGGLSLPDKLNLSALGGLDGTSTVRGGRGGRIDLTASSGSISSTANTAFTQSMSTNGAVCGFQAGCSITLDAQSGSISVQSVSPLDALFVGAFANTGINLRSNARSLVLRNGGNTATGSGQNITVNNVNTAGVTLEFASNSVGGLSLTSAGDVVINGAFPQTGTTASTQDAPMGIKAQSVSISSTNNIIVNRSVIATNGNTDLSATGNLTIQPQLPYDYTPLNLTTLAPNVQISGQNINLNAANISVSGNTASAPTVVPFVATQSPNSGAPAYPQVTSSLFSNAGAVSLEASNALTLSATGSVNLSGTSIGSQSTTGTGVQLGAPQVNLQAASLNLSGGSATNRYAYVQYGTGLQLAISGGGASIQLSPGSGTNADAAIYGTVAPSTTSTPNYASCTSCTPDWVAGTSPLLNTAANMGITTMAPTSAPLASGPVAQQALTVALLTTAQQTQLEQYLESTPTVSNTGTTKPPADQALLADCPAP